MTEKVTDIRIGERVTNPTIELKIYDYKRRRNYFREVITNAVF